MASKMLFASINIGKVEIKNRVVFPSMCTNHAEPDGSINTRIKEFTRERAQGGVGMIIIPGNPYGKNSSARPSLAGPQFFSGWRELGEIVRSCGGKLFCQLHPARPQAGQGFIVKNPIDFTRQEIKQVIDNYVQGALNAYEAGLDGIEIHGAHAHEIAQFMSPYYNKRNDEYGNNTAGRTKLAVQIIEGIKEACGDKIPVIFRLSGSEMIDGGRKIEESIICSSLIADAGADALHISIGMPESGQWIAAPMEVEQGFNVPAAAAVKQRVDVPVIAVGRILDPVYAEFCLQEGKADMIAMGRALLADPQLLLKYKTGNEPIRRCIGCNQGCRSLMKGGKTFCLQNPRTGRESELVYSLAQKSKAIMIVGAGPAGLEAAMVLAERGHKPVLYEKDDEVGGLLKAALVPPDKEAIENVIVYRKTALKEKGVQVIKSRATEKEIIESDAEAVIVATGSSPQKPPIKGLNGENVHFAEAVLINHAPLGSKVAVLGGGLVGCETASYLSAQGKKVIIYEQAEDIAKELDQNRKYFLLKKLRDNFVEVRLLAEIVEVDLPEITVQSGCYRQKETGFDNLVIACGRIPNNEVAEAIKRLPKSNLTVYTIGDAKTPGLAIDAIYEAASLSAKI